MISVRKLRRFITKPIGREYRIRFRLFRSKLMPSAIQASRRAEFFLISYPKCGRTWLRMLVSRALAAHIGTDEVDYLATDILDGAGTGIPHIRISHDDDPHWKTAHQLDKSKRKFAKKKVILLVRDPRDVVVSMYFERSRREQAYSKSLHEYLQEPKGSLQTILAYYNIWAAARDVPNRLHLIRYEDLQADTANELGRLLEFVGINDISDTNLEDAVQFASFDSMRKMEDSNQLQSGRLRPRDPSDKESFKTRRGKIGGYVDYLNADEIAWMDAEIAAKLDPYFGYHEPPTAASLRLFGESQ